MYKTEYLHRYLQESRVQEMSQPEHVKDPSVEFVKSRLLGAAAEAKFVRDPKIYSLAVTLKIADVKDSKRKTQNIQLTSC
jgi:hypothetical protein